MNEKLKEIIFKKKYLEKPIVQHKKSAKTYWEKQVVNINEIHCKKFLEI